LVGRLYTLGDRNGGLAVLRELHSRESLGGGLWLALGLLQQVFHLEGARLARSSWRVDNLAELEKKHEGVRIFHALDGQVFRLCLTKHLSVGCHDSDLLACDP